MESIHDTPILKEMGSAKIRRRLSWMRAFEFQLLDGAREARPVGPADVELIPADDTHRRPPPQRSHDRQPLEERAPPDQEVRHFVFVPAPLGPHFLDAADDGAIL